MSTTTRTHTPKVQTFEQAFSKLMEQPGQTRQELNLLPVYVKQLQDEKLLKVVGKVETGQRGRPALKYALTDKARKRVKRQQAKAAA